MTPIGTPDGASATAASVVIDYDRLYQQYLRSLVDTLRGFSSGIEGLESWVPSEDPLRSLTHLLEAAAAEGRRSLAIEFGPESAPLLDRPALEELVTRFGGGRVSVRPDQILVELPDLRVPVGSVSSPTGARSPGVTPVRSGSGPDPATAAVQPPPPSPALGAPYARALAAGAPPFAHEGVLPAEAPGEAARVRIESHFQGARLGLQVAAESHTVIAARWSGALPGTMRALLDRFCAMLEGLPLLEAAQHGVIRLEHDLRDDQQPPPVAGVVTPEAAHPMFELPGRLIEAALDLYRARTGYRETDNRYDAPLAPAWLAASPAERLLRLEGLLPPCRQKLGLRGDQLRACAVEHDVRVVVGLDPALPGEEQRRALLVYEKAIQDAIDPRLEVHAEERKDRNKLRRLALVAEET